jgi:GGDEF domain-containing protein
VASPGEPVSALGRSHLHGVPEAHCGAAVGRLASRAMKPLIHWAVPGGVLLAGAFALKMGLGPEGLVEGAVSRYPWAVYGIGVLLGAFFHRSRVVLATLALAVTAWVAASKAGGFTALYFAGGLLALSLGLVTLLKDRGVFSTGGILQIGGGVVVGVFATLFVGMAPQDMAVFLDATPLPLAVSVWSGFPQPVFLAFVLALATSCVAALVRKGPVERGAFWSLVAVALALYLTTDGASVQLFLMAAGLTLGLSVVEVSYAMAYRDDLTGLPARRALMRDLDALRGLYTAAMVDVDYFKRFNDRYGHEVGDQVLRMVGGQLAKAPGGGRAYRYGGEEFTVLFPGKSRQEALEHLERIRRMVEDATFILRHWRRPRKKPVDPGGWKSSKEGKSKQLSVTVSIGLADSAGGEAEPEEVLKKADSALYRAKKAGRNRVAK